MSWNGFLTTLTLLFISSIAFAIWENRLKKRYGEMLAILDRIQTLHRSGELWRHTQEVPLSRQNFLRRECYAYTLTGFALLIAIGFGIHESIELINTDWLSAMDKNLENYSGAYRISAKGWMFIGLLRVFPFYACFVFASNGYSTIVWLRHILPDFSKYLKRQIRG